jgi:LCP family protein required for cell wall assembly
VDETPNGPAGAAPEQTRTLPPELDPRGPRRPGPPAPPDGTDPPGGTPPRPRRSRRRRILTWLAGGVAAVVLLSSLTGWAMLEHLVNGIRHINPFCHSCSRPSGGVKGDLNILIVGSDSRAGLTTRQQSQLHVGHDAGQRSDTMILLHIPRGGGRVVLVSLPRDSYVTIPRHKDASGHWVPVSKNKLNAAYSFGGPALTVRTVERATGVRIDHYVEINFLGFVNMVNAVGGVTVCTPTPIHDPVHYDPQTGGNVGSGLELPAGRSTLNGTRALEYVRAREFDPSADLGRIQRQQKFIAALVQKVESLGVLLNPVRMYNLVGAVGKSLTTDGSFGVSQMKRLALDMRSTSPTHVEMIRVPLKTGNFATPVGDVVEWAPTASHRLFRDLTLDRPVSSGKSKLPAVPLAPSSVSVKVLNATGTQGFAATAAAKLATVGFQIGGTGNAPKGSDPKVTVVRYGPSREQSAQTVAAAVPGSKLVLDSSLGSGLELIVGSNFHGVQKVRVVATGASGTLANPRTASQNICS